MWELISTLKIDYRYKIILGIIIINQCNYFTTLSDGLSSCS